MTALRQQAMRLVGQIPEAQMPDIIQYLHSISGKAWADCSLESETDASVKMKAFLELEKMIKPVPGLDYKKEMEEARDEKYGRFD